MNLRIPTLSGSALKVLALAAMTCDHAAKFFSTPYPGLKDPLFTAFGVGISWYGLLMGFGRMAFPLFAFLAVEGFLHTRSLRRYMATLLVAAIISEPAYDYAFTGTTVCPCDQNIIFTLFTGLMAVLAAASIRDENPEAPRRTALVAAACGIITLCIGAAWYFNLDYGARGVAFMLLLYAARKNSPERAAVGSCILPDTWKAGLAFIPIALYDGRRGFIKKPWLKYAFYAYYPLHLFLLRIAADRCLP